MLWLIGLAGLGLVVFLVVRNNKKDAEIFAGKLKSVADLNKDGKVDLKDAKVAEEKIVDAGKKVAAKAKKIAGKKKK